MNAHIPSHQPYAGHSGHHPGEDLLAAYASGALDEASALVISSHLALCPLCRHETAVYEAVGGQLVDSLPAAPLADDALAMTMARAKAAPRPSTKPAQAVAPRGNPLLPAPLRQYVGGDFDAAKWSAIGPGIHHMPLVRSGDVVARLLRIGPGRSVFDHGHSGTELTLVLKGSYTSLGQRFVRGDIEVADEDTHHRPVAGMEDVCVCLAVTDAPLRFDNWLGRLMQPFIGI
jgi:putative transcriptional regulator